MNGGKKSLENLRLILLAGLKTAIHAHDMGDDLGIGKGYDEFDALLPRDFGGNPSEDDKALFDALHIGLRLWDEWADEANHGWPAFEGREKIEWRKLVALFLSDLEDKRLPISHRLVLTFPKPGPTWFDRFLQKLKR